MSDQTKNYEIAYLISSTVPEDGVLGITGKITQAITNNQGTIRHAEEPHRRQLSYPINKEEQAYFGWTTFNILPSNVGTVKKAVESDNNILRHLITEEVINARPIQPMRLRTIQASPSVKPILREDEAGGEKLDLEALDKKLEEILGK